jgi:rhamnosyltransferase
MEVNGKVLRQLAQHKENPGYITNKQQIFIIGSKGIPAQYGGFETFVEKLTEYQVSDQIRYHVSRIAADNKRYEYNGAKCFDIKVPDIGAAKAIYYDLAALQYCIGYCKARPSIKHPVFYVLACRIGPFVGYFRKEIDKIGGVLYVNPDGHEWMRAKWNVVIRRYWKFSERLMIKHSDLLVCDSINIEKYIKREYKKYHPQTVFIAYGADTRPSVLPEDDEGYTGWLERNNLEKGKYYIIVGRFVPENSFKTMIREFMRSRSKKSLAIITTTNDRLLEELERELHFRKDKRIQFVSTVYDQELLKKIRENAYGYLHGHTVGGTNPSLLEALGSTKLNLLVDVGFNREVGQDAALYWDKKDGSLAALINQADSLDIQEIAALEEKAKKRIREAYSWESIVETYERLFLNHRSQIYLEKRSTI